MIGGTSVNLTVNSNQTTKLVTAFQYHSFADNNNNSKAKLEDGKGQRVVTQPTFFNEAQNDTVNVERIQTAQLFDLNHNNNGDEQTSEIINRLASRSANAKD